MDEEDAVESQYSVDEEIMHVTTNNNLAVLNASYPSTPSKYSLPPLFLSTHRFHET